MFMTRFHTKGNTRASCTKALRRVRGGLHWPDESTPDPGTGLTSQMMIVHERSFQHEDNIKIWQSGKGHLHVFRDAFMQTTAQSKPCETPVTRSLLIFSVVLLVFLSLIPEVSQKVESESDAERGYESNAQISHL